MTTQQGDARPRLTLRVGVTGHRPNKLSEDAAERVAERIGPVLRAAAQVVATIGADHPWAFASDRPRTLRLTSALAEGADQLVADAALAEGYELHGLLPMPRAAYRQTFADADAVAFERLSAQASVLCELVPTGDLQQPARRDAAYLAGGRAMLDHCDLLIAIWDEQPAAGVGGTAQILEEAQRRGLVVIWLPLDGRDPQLWQPVSPDGSSVDQADDGTWLPLGDTDSTVAKALTMPLNAVLAPPGDGTGKMNQPNGARSSLQAFLAERVRSGSYACGYDLLRRLFAGRAFSPRLRYADAAEQRQSWAKSLDAAEQIGGDDFRQRLQEALFQRWFRADAVALHWSHVYRSTFLLNFVLAAVAVLVGLLAVLDWKALDLKAAMVGLEVLIIGGIVWLTRAGQKGRWHERWLEARAIAEALRPTRLLALVGVTPLAAAGNGEGRATDDWIAWYIRACWREIGPPSGRLDEAAYRRALEVALTEEIGDDRTGQLAYNRNTATQLHAIDHGLHRSGERLFVFTALSGLLFLLFYLLYLLGDSTLAKATKPYVTLIGGAFPAFGAAVFGIRATGDFTMSEHRCRETATALHRVAGRIRGLLAAGADSMPPGEVEAVLAKLTEILSADLDVWHTVYRQRKIELPG